MVSADENELVPSPERDVHPLGADDTYPDLETVAPRIDRSPERFSSTKFSDPVPINDDSEGLAPHPPRSLPLDVEAGRAVLHLTSFVPGPARQPKLDMSTLASSWVRKARSLRIGTSETNMRP